MEKNIGEEITFFSSENNVMCRGIILAIIITKNNIIYKAKINKQDIRTALEYMNECYDYRKYPNDVYVKNNRDITDDFNIELI